MEKQLLTNSFHNSTAWVLPKHTTEAGDDVRITLSQSQANRARRKLCGIRDCLCGGNAGQRGTQRTADGRRLIVIIEP